MPLPNPDKCYQQQPLPIQPAASKIPDNWLILLGNLICDHVLKLSAFEKSTLIANLNEKAGDKSSYSLKESLVESLQFVFSVLTDAKTPHDKKIVIAEKIHEGIAMCAPGFHNRVNEIIISTTTPNDLDDLLATQRQAIVASAATQALHQLQITNKLNLRTEVHTYNRYFVVACSQGYGVRALNDEDIYQGQLSVEHIIKDLQLAFASKYSFFKVLNETLQQLAFLIKERGYTGKRADGYSYQEFGKFDNEFLKKFVEITAQDLFVTIEDQDEVPIVIDINWKNIKIALMNKLRSEEYFLFTEEESHYLDTILNNQLTNTSIKSKAKTLFHDESELLQAITYFTDYLPENNITELVSFYFQDKTDQRKIAFINSIPHLTNKALLLSRAIYMGNHKQVFSLIEDGGDLNIALDFLFSTQRFATFHWLHQHPQWLDKITDAALKMPLGSGKHKGKSLASLLVNSKKGLQLLAQSSGLREKCQSILGGDIYNDYILPLQEMGCYHHIGLYQPQVDAVTSRFIKAVADADFKSVNYLLNANFNLKDSLLMTKLAVKYRSNKYVYGNALQIAMQLIDIFHFQEYSQIINLLSRINIKNKLLSAYLEEACVVEFNERMKKICETHFPIAYQNVEKNSDYFKVLIQKFNKACGNKSFRERWLLAAIDESNLAALKAIQYPPSDTKKHGLFDKEVTLQELRNYQYANNKSLLDLALLKSNQTILDYLFQIISQSDLRKDPYQAKLIHYAISLNQSEEVIIQVLSHNDINAMRKKNITPLHIATNYNRPNLVRLLIKLGANVNAAAFDGATALHMAAISGNIEIIKILLSAGADVNTSRYHNAGTPLHIAVLNQHHDAAVLLLQHGADVNARKNTEETVALHDAVTNDDIEMVRILINHGADINLAFNSGSTALHIAAYKNHLAIAKLLLLHDVDTTRQLNKPRKTALDIAMDNKHYHLALAIYAYDLNKRPDDNHLHSFKLFDKTLIEFGCSAYKKKLALDALIQVVEGNADASTLDEHDAALNNGRMKIISRGIRPNQAAEQRDTLFVDKRV